jgi:2-keto-4-pentenoate hydratase/2-oxohepta-3-ene-1,7-dioic acid hydratase in catechol pathway
MQSQRTIDHIHDVDAIVSFISQTSTLYPGDVIYTGTPGSTTAMQPGDVIEIEVEGVGVLRNQIAR